MNKSLELKWETFSEEVVIGELINSSKEFRDFYESERKKIISPIQWVKDSSMPEGIDFRATRLSNGKCFIRLRRIPVDLEDAIKIAHELEHFVLDAKGFHSIGATDGLENLASAISSMVSDLLVNEKLAEFGFGLQEDYENEAAEGMRQLEQIEHPPSTWDGKLLWIVNYVSKLLDWEFVSGSNSESDFQSWFDNKYPDIAKSGKKLRSIVKRIGYDTPEKQIRLFREVIQKYNLESLLIIK